MILSNIKFATRYAETSEEYTARCTMHSQSADATQRKKECPERFGKPEYRHARRERDERPVKRGQARKGTGWMPWHWEPMKDATSCEKLRGAANEP